MPLKPHGAATRPYRSHPNRLIPAKAERPICLLDYVDLGEYEQP